MKTTLEQFRPLSARILISLIFVMSGISKLAAPTAIAGYIASKGLPMPLLLALSAGVLELLGGLLILLGLRARWGALALVAFLVPTTLIFHNPTGLEGMAAQMEMIQVMKNLAIMGGLVAIAAFGSGALSLDSVISQRLKRRQRVEQPA